MIAFYAILQFAGKYVCDLKDIVEMLIKHHMSILKVGYSYKKIQFEFAKKLILLNGITSAKSNLT